MEKHENPVSENQNDGQEQEATQKAAIDADLKAEIESLKSELEEKKDSYLRVSAEYDNFRKRSAKEKDAIFEDAYSSAIACFLPVFDNLERAVLYPDGDGLKKGLDLVIKQLYEVMEKQNIKQVNPVGEPFDPELHNAVMHVEDENLGEGVVVEVLQKGYMVGERVVRHAMVKVAN